MLRKLILAASVLALLPLASAQAGVRVGWGSACRTLASTTALTTGPTIGRMLACS
jgi:hypothetical protein